MEKELLDYFLYMSAKEYEDKAEDNMSEYDKVNIKINPFTSWIETTQDEYKD